jgi:hypothetical protein
MPFFQALFSPLAQLRTFLAAESRELTKAASALRGNHLRLEVFAANRQLLPLIFLDAVDADARPRDEIPPARFTLTADIGHKATIARLFYFGAGD